jgi:GntR family transcriptional regulator
MGRKRPTRPKLAGTASLPEDAARYISLAEELGRRMKDGRLKPRDRIPGEHELAREFAVSRVTVRAALAILAKKALIVKRPGIGTFVASSRLHHDLAVLESLFGQFPAQGVRPESKTIEYRPTTLGNGDALAGYGEGMLLRRTWYVDGTAFAVTQTHMHPRARSVSYADAERYPCYDILEKLLGFQIARADLKIRAEKAGATIAKALEIDPADPILVLNRTSYSEANEPLEHTECALRADAIEFDFAVHGSDALSAAFQRPLKRPLASRSRQRAS